MPREVTSDVTRSIERPVDQLHPKPLRQVSKLVVIHVSPGQGANDVDVVDVNRFEHFTQEVLVVQRAVEVIAYLVIATISFARDLEGEFCNDDAGWLEGIPDVPELVTNCGNSVSLNLMLGE